MCKLLYGNFERIKKDRFFRGELLTALFLPAFIILNSYFQTNLTNAYVFKLIARFFGYAPLLGVFVAVFAARLWGTDYEFGTIRNKLVCGHRRREVYFSNLITICCAGLGVALVWLIVNIGLGVPLLGAPSVNLSSMEIVIYTASSFQMVIALSSIFCLIAGTTESKTKGTLLCLGAAAAMVVVGMLLFDQFAEPKLLDGWMSGAENPSIRWHPENDRYIGGNVRTLLELAICLFPGGQGVILCEEGVEHLAFLPLCSAVVIGLTTLLGLHLFEKKDIK